MVERYIYLDYAATAPLRPEALEAQARYRALPESLANPNSLHTLGRKANMALERARRDITADLGGNFRSNEIAFTGGGTESNNMALFGIAEGVRAKDASRTRILISSIEHDSVLDLAAPLRKRGFTVELIPVDRDGSVHLDVLGDMLGSDVALVSVMSANNETGVVQPIGALAHATHEVGAYFHTDAVQAFGRIPLDIDDCDAVSVAGHKIGAPLGTGFLALRTRCPFAPQSFGGGQEQGRRAGTQDVCAAVALAAVSRLVTSSMPQTRPQVAARANSLYKALCAEGTGIVPTTRASIEDDRLPGLVSIMVPGIDSETLILRLDASGFEVSAGSACSSASLDPSHVLSAMGIPREQALGSLRISFDERTDPEDLSGFAKTLLELVAELKR